MRTRCDRRGTEGRELAGFGVAAVLRHYSLGAVSYIDRCAVGADCHTACIACRHFLGVSGFIDASGRCVDDDSSLRIQF